MTSYRERRDANWERMVGWSDRHRHLALVTVCFMAFVTICAAGPAVAGVVNGSLGGFLFFALACVVGVWTTWSWIRARRGEERASTWRG